MKNTKNYDYISKQNIYLLGNNLSNNIFINRSQKVISFKLTAIAHRLGDQIYYFGTPEQKRPYKHCHYIIYTAFSHNIGYAF